MPLTYLKQERITGIDGVPLAGASLAMGADRFYIATQSAVIALDRRSFSRDMPSGFALPSLVEDVAYAGAVVYGEELYLLQVDSRYDLEAVQIRSGLIRPFRLGVGEAQTPLAVHVGIEAPTPPVAGLLFDGERFAYLGRRDDGGVYAITARTAAADVGRSTATAERVSLRQIDVSPSADGVGRLVSAANCYCLLDIAGKRLLGFTASWEREPGEDVALHAENSQPIAAVWDGGAVVVLDAAAKLFFYGELVTARALPDSVQQWSLFDDDASVISVGRRNRDNSLVSIVDDALAIASIGVIPEGVTDPVAIETLESRAIFTPKFTLPDVQIGDILTADGKVWAVRRIAGSGRSKQAFHCEVTE